MLASSRRLFLISAIALYGATAVLGVALHALPGAVHAGVEASAADCLGGGASHDCPICHFLAQGQVAVDLTSVPVSGDFDAIVDVGSEQNPSSSFDPAPNPRAPPLG